MNIIEFENIKSRAEKGLATNEDCLALVKQFEEYESSEIEDERLECIIERAIQNEMPHAYTIALEIKQEIIGLIKPQSKMNSLICLPLH